MSRSNFIDEKWGGNKAKGKASGRCALRPRTHQREQPLAGLLEDPLP